MKILPNAEAEGGHELPNWHRFCSSPASFLYTALARSPGRNLKQQQQKKLVKRTRASKSLFHCLVWKENSSVNVISASPTRSAALGASSCLVSQVVDSSVLSFC